MYIKTNEGEKFVYFRGQVNTFYMYYSAEPMWIISEFGIIVLNLVKLKALLGRRLFQAVSIVMVCIGRLFKFASHLGNELNHLYS